MKIGFDIRTIAQGKHSGVEEYTLRILNELLKNKNEEFLLFYNAFLKADIPENILENNNVVLKDFNVPNKILDAFLFFGQPKLDKLVGGSDVFFSPHFLVAPVSKNCKKVTIFHDLSFLHYPEFFSLRKKYWHFTQRPKKQAIESDKIIAISESTKEDIVNFYKIPEEKIQVVYSGVNESMMPLKKDDKKLKYVKEKYSLPGEFILYLGTIEPRKNIVGIIRAFEGVREKKKIKLVLAGALGWLYKDILKEAKNSRFSDDIIFLGFVDDSDKIGLYNLALVFVYPSFFEGFGFPPLEAMACGVPVVTSNCSSLPEVVGEAALMIDPYKSSEIADAMWMFLEDEELRNIYKERGLLQAKKFTWKKAGEETLKIIRL
jgi:glycosyltransferase involved in cell wall biosynthesis